MAEYVVYERETGDFAYAYTADAATDFIEFPFSRYNHILKKPDDAPASRRRVTKLEFVERLGDSAFDKLLELSLSSITIMKFVKLIDWATPEQDGTSIDLDDPRVQKIVEIEPLLVATGDVSPGWAAKVLE